MDFKESFIEYLKKEAELKIETVTSWVPIANLEVETPFPIAKSEIRPLSKTIVDSWEKEAVPKAGEVNKGIQKFFGDVRKDYQGLAAIVTTIEAEPEHAFDCAIEEAEQVTSILGIFSAATVLPDIKCVSKIKGSEYVATATVIFEKKCNALQMQESVVDKASIHCWRLSKNDILEVRRIGLDGISKLLFTDEALSSFEKSVLNSVFLYSKSAFTADPVEKVIYMLSALESILLKNENEPIQQNLGERLAFFIETEREKRKEIIKVIKNTYAVRSRYLHHGHSSSELELISNFMKYIWVFFMMLIGSVNQFNSKEDFLSEIEDRKFT